MKTWRVSNTLDQAIRNLAATGRGRKQAVSMLIDGLICMLALWFAYSLRFGIAFSDFRSTFHLFLLLPILTVTAFSALGVYRWVVRSTNSRLVKQLLKGSLLSSMALVLLLFLAPPDRVNPRSLMVIHGMFLFLGSGGLRFLWQGLFSTGRQGMPVAIYGAGEAGRKLVALLNTGSEYQPVVFIDDNERMHASTVAGLPVVGGDTEELKSRLLPFDPTLVILAMPTLEPAAYRARLDKISGLNLPVQTVPNLSELVSGKARADEIRDIELADLLGRQEVLPNAELMARRVRHQSVLVTGGGGSIGSELCRQILELEPRRLLVLDNCEVNLYHITEEVRGLQERNDRHANIEFVPILCSVTDGHRVQELMRRWQVSTVYHAAAYKHVPIIEEFPGQGVETNTFGTLTAIDAAIEAEVKHFVLISTDKAVRPTSVMGATKRIAELILQAKARLGGTTCISIVRFGNVLGSSGSVIPKFRRQIENGGPVTITHPEVTRFFMTIPEASQLVLQASAIAEGGEVFVLDMGKPVKIVEMAEALIGLCGKRLRRDTGSDKDIEIVFEGLRPGEKMYEELFLTGEHRPTSVPKVLCAAEAHLPWQPLSARLSTLQHLVSTGETEAIRDEVLSVADVGHAAEIAEDEPGQSLVANAGRSPEIAQTA